MFNVVCISIFDVMCVSVLMLNISLRIAGPNIYVCLFLAKKWIQNGVYRKCFFFFYYGIDMKCARSLHFTLLTYSFKNKELLTITKNLDTPLNSSVLWNSVKNFKANGEAVLVLAFGEHENLRFLLISLLVHYQNSPDTILLI